MHQHFQNFGGWLARVLFLVLAVVSLEAEEVVPKGDADYVVDFWRTEQGLPHNTVSAILQTKDGYLWVGTADGLARFDGLTFTFIGDETATGLKGARITALLETLDGTLWIGTQGKGLFKLQGGLVRRLAVADGLADNAVTSLAQDPAGTVWIGTQRGLNRWLTNRLDTFTSEGLRAGEAVVALYAGRSGATWITTRSEVFKMHEGKVEPFRNENVPLEGSAELRGAYEDRAGNLWTFSASFLLNLSQTNRYNAFQSLDPASSRVWTICEQDDGTFWIGTSGRGLVRFSKGRFDKVGSREGLDQCDVRALFSDHEGNLWIGTSDNGLVRLRVRQWQTFTASDGLVSPKLSALAAEPGGDLWIGTEDAGLVRYNGSRFESFSSGFPFSSAMRIQSLCVDRSGALWAGTWGGGLLRFAGGQQWHYGTGQGLSDDVITAVVAEPGADAVWAGTRAGGLHRISPTNVMSFTESNGLAGEAVRCLLFTRGGRLIVGSEGGSLVSWDGQRLAPMQIPAGVVNRAVRCLTEDRAGRLWIGTDGAGAFCRLGSSWVNLGMTHGLASDVVGAITQDRAGNYWFGSDAGIFQVRTLDMQSFLNGAASSVTSLFSARGQGIGEVKCADGWPAALVTQSGALWFASSGGLLLVDPLNLKASTPRVMIERVSLDGAVVSPVVLGRPDAPLELGPSVRSLDFNFTAISFNAPEKTRFRYKMEGFDPGWAGPDLARRAHYGPLPPGSYRFRVIASSADGVWNETGASVALVVLPPIWRAWWFLMLCGAALVGTIWLIVRYVLLRRLRAQLKQSEQRRAMERERTRIAQDMHDEIGSKLTRISFLSEVARHGAKGPGDNGATVEAIAVTSRELLQALDEIVWAVNPRNDNLEHLAGYLEQYAREYFQRTAIQCEIAMPSFLPEVELTAEVRHNVFLAFEEALGNTLKHANPAKVNIEMSLTEGAFVVTVQDDGRGFTAQDARAQSGRNGLNNMRTRLQAIGGGCETVSEPGRGTTVRLKCPLPETAFAST